MLDEVVGAVSGFELAAGIDEDGHGVYLDLRNASGVICGGLPGGGKTQWLTSALASFAGRPEMQWLLIDGKQGHDLAVLAPRAYRYLSEDESGDLAMVRDVLKEVQLLMRERLSHSVELFGHPNLWTAGPSPAHPLVVVVIDECQQYFDSRSLLTKEDKATGAEIQAIVKDLVKRGRSAGLVTILSTQRPTADAIPTSIRDNASLRVCFGVRTRESAAAVLGEFSSESTVSPIGAPIGVGVTLARGSFVRFRTPYTSESALARHVSKFASLSGDPLDLLSKAIVAL
ncbi:ATP-binding protein [Mycobacterium intracellulare]|uniref:ATP-binding protein n=1 Tax=Mycobacterium intracellulare TaxID=1767 RepID=A0AAE4RE75_MYCIT|nr:ATP-binding protein [Mycobacterium intracellulare]MCA2320436.1 ATP-binding protein [Mycobacterium intracellulare]MCA2340886.1 ATP-binding protein [Mycobacterium intracellulare]MDV6979049.1 ATP-binding protein [Mycobacterium intracellulare]MDV6984355.1 ATP-binding protein [Mycobacterium intracellulare]MDV7014065.1 ATP-binding protein [Mycobacterium intracellulare]